jgi:hypothetical protein
LFFFFPFLSTVSVGRSFFFSFFLSFFSFFFLSLTFFLLLLSTVRTIAFLALLAGVQLAHADVYMHNPRGSNNRLNEVRYFFFFFFFFFFPPKNQSFSANFRPFFKLFQLFSTHCRRFFSGLEVTKSRRKLLGLVRKSPFFLTGGLHFFFVLFCCGGLFFFFFFFLLFFVSHTKIMLFFSFVFFFLSTFSYFCGWLFYEKNECLGWLFLLFFNMCRRTTTATTATGSLTLRTTSCVRLSVNFGENLGFMRRLSRFFLRFVRLLAGEKALKMRFSTRLSRADMHFFCY